MFGELLLGKYVAHATYVYHCARYSANSSTNLHNYLVFIKYRMCIAAFSRVYNGGTISDLINETLPKTRKLHTPLE